MSNIAKDFFDFTEFFSKTKKQEVVLSPDPYPLVHPVDTKIFHLLTYIGADIVVAGGCALSWYQQQPVGLKDIDVWFKSQRNFDRLSEFLNREESRCRKVYDTENAETWKITISTEMVYRVQLIKNKFYNRPEELIEDFDITVCQIATDGHTWWHSDRFCQDLKDRRLAMTKTHPGSVKRLIKYWTYGFQPDDAVIQQISVNPETKWDFSNQTDEEYANAI